MLIKCKSLGLLIDENSRVFPCCYLATMEDKSPVLSSLDSEWNNLKVKTMDEILNHPVYKEHLTPKSWSDEKVCDPICLMKCKSNE